ncbi:telomerase protein component 1-like [Amphiura filiformis]|uniref:telomerase protein component 1-like n=1 Tax=Amphiura filiformis TaxID=82378 RepID=UPI003B222E17
MGSKVSKSRKVKNKKTGEKDREQVAEQTAEPNVTQGSSCGSLSNAEQGVQDTQLETSETGIQTNETAESVRQSGVNQNMIAETWPEPSDDPEVTTHQCWETIDTQCLTHSTRLQDVSESQTTSGWKVVRLFVSSTFNDYQNEREVLVKKVFPELREWCESRHLHLIECDLRWGVPKDSTTRTVLCTCLEELDRCHEDADGEGFFMNMLAERYGWVPKQDDVPPDVADRYQWVPNVSITHMEILHGAFRAENPNAAFFIRRAEGYLDDVPKEAAEKGFVDKAEIAKVQMKELKKRLHERFPNSVFEYDCQFDGVHDGRIQLKGLEAFGKQVLDFFKEAIGKKYPEIAGETASPEQIEEQQHGIYMVQKGQLVFGREKEIEVIMKYANEEASADEGVPPLIVAADPGQGKSALMARSVMEAKKAGLNVFSHFVGCTAESNRVSSVIARLCKALANKDDPRLSKLTSETSNEEANKILTALLEEYGKSGDQLLIVVDAVNQLGQEDAFTKEFKWIPTSCHGKVRFVTSTTHEGNTLTDLQKRIPEAKLVALSQLNEDAKRDIVKNYFGRFNKTLDPGQLKMLTEAEGANNPLWLSMACEELRVFGIFEKVTEYISGLPETLEGLLAAILARLIREDESKVVEKMLCYLECSQQGLKETELQLILSDDMPTPIAMLFWSMARRTLKPFLRSATRSGEVERLQFFHMSIRRAVQTFLDKDQSTLQAYHSKLADYFLNHCTDDATVILEVPYQLSRAKSVQKLIDFFRKDSRGAKVHSFQRSQYLKKFRCMTPVNQPNMCTQYGMCQFCENGRGAFGQTPFPNKDCCIQCGNFVPPNFKNDKQAAMSCTFHPPPGPRFPGKHTCIVCSKAIHLPPGRKPTLAYLCQFCQLGGFKTCCKIKTDGR